MTDETTATPEMSVEEVLHTPALRKFLEKHVSVLTFNALPAGWEDDHHYFEVRVCRRGDGAYAVLNARNDVLSDKDAWDYEPMPSSRTDKFIRHHRFTLDEAVARAQKIAPQVTLMGKTAAEYVAWQTERAQLDPDEDQ